MARAAALNVAAVKVLTSGGCSCLCPAHHTYICAAAQQAQELQAAAVAATVAALLV